MATPTKKTMRLTTAQAIVKYLQVQFSERDGNRERLIPALFGIFGHGNVAGLGQALYEYGDQLPYYQPCNEQAMVHTACGFARARRRLATLACTSSIGPGATNMITGAATATINRWPVLLLPSDYYASRYQGPVLQQLEHPISADVSVNDCFRPVSRFFDRILRPEQLLTALPEAMRVLTDPADTGAVTLSLPQDVQPQAYDYPVHFFEERTWRVERRSPDRERIKEAVALLKKAKRPLLIAGGGVHYSEAWKEVQSFAEACGIPIAETFAGKGVVRKESKLLLGGIGISGTTAATSIAAQADLVIAVGTRLTDCVTGSQSCFHHPDVRFVGINVCAYDAYKQGGLPITADAREGLRALLRAAKAAGIKPGRAYVREVAALNQEWATQIQKAVCGKVRDEGMNQAQLAGVINEEARAGDTIMTAAGTQLMALHQVGTVSRGNEYHLEFGYSCMGHELPAGLGVRLARPEGEVIVYLGDGTYLMNPVELVTAVQENLKLTVVIGENHGYQSIWGLQMDRAGQEFGNEFRSRDAASKRLEGEYLSIDFARNAESMGARVWKVTTPDEVRAALRQARVEAGTCVIVAEIEPHGSLPDSGMWWDIPVAETSGNKLTQTLRARNQHQRKLQRFHY